MTNRTHLAILLAVIGAFFVGTGVASSDAIDTIGVVLLLFLILACQGIATPPKRREPKPEADPDEAWRKAVDES
jgi:hypothetical protein